MISLRPPAGGYFAKMREHTVENGERKVLVQVFGTNVPVQSCG
jgi:hypothetical protein